VALCVNYFRFCDYVVFAHSDGDPNAQIDSSRVSTGVGAKSDIYDLFESNKFYEYHPLRPSSVSLDADTVQLLRTFETNITEKR